MQAQRHSKHAWWSWINGKGVEHVRTRRHGTGWSADGVLVAVDPRLGPVSLGYHVRVDSAGRTRDLRVRPLLEGDGLHVRADRRGRWRTAAGRSLPALEGCLDADLMGAAFTNTLAVRRLRLAVGQTASIRVAYVRLPGLHLKAVTQRYTRLERRGRGARYRYENPSTRFSARLDIDSDGFVTHYEGLFRRVPGAHRG